MLPPQSRYKTSIHKFDLLAIYVQDTEFQHGASVLAEWLDNDEDGCVDTPEVLLAAILILIRSL